jgi:UDP-4-amino-4-deoxy-L-arabinose formyltransferase/UDP-glucuronic acid dehydrogenase (UDP-4-keto-hexauronic acid decarboxylating)
VLERGHELVGVLTSGASATGATSVAAAAGAAVVPVWPARRVADPELAQELRAANVDLFLNVHSLFVVEESVLAAARIGAFNLHPGPLPEFAGLDAPSWALYEGRRTYGCTVHWMTSAIDAGPIAYAASFEIAPDETGLSLNLKCMRHGLELLGELLDAAAADAPAVPAAPQPRTGRRRLRRGPPGGGRIDWGSPAARIVGLVRACDFGPFRSPWGRAHTTIAGRELAIVEAEITGRSARVVPGTIGERTAEGALVAAADEWVLVRRVALGDDVTAAAETLPQAGRLGDIQSTE